MELVFLIVLFAVGLLQFVGAVIDYRADEKLRAAYFDLRCQKVIRDFQQRVKP